MAGGKRGSWSAQENDIIRRLYGVTPKSRLARRLGRSEERIDARARLLFTTRRRGRWREEERERLRAMIGVASLPEMALVLGRSRRQVARVLASLAEEPKRGSWTLEEKRFLRRNYGSRSDRDLAHALGRTELALRRMAARLALEKDKEFAHRRGGEPRRMPRWQADEIARLRSFYPFFPNLEVARRLGRSLRAVVSKASQMGLRKNSSVLSRAGRTSVAQRRDR